MVEEKSCVKEALPEQGGLAPITALLGELLKFRPPAENSGDSFQRNLPISNYINSLWVL